jgi:hypothetical protein
MRKDRKFDRNEGKQRPRNDAPDKRQAIKDSMEWAEADADYDDQYNRRGKHERRRRETDIDSR